MKEKDKSLFRMQTMSVMEQLIYGVRYLDINVGYDAKDEDKKWWYAVDETMRLVPLQEIFDQMKKFLVNTNEIIILDIQKFKTNDGKPIMKQFIEYLKAELGDHLITRKHVNGNIWDTPLSSIWATNKSLIISCNHVSWETDDIFHHPILYNKILDHR